MARHTVIELVKRTGVKWNDCNAPRLGAALAFYTLFSLAPLAVLVVAICGIFLNRSTAEQELILRLRDMVGPAGASTIQSLMDNAHQRSGIVASSLAVGTLLVGASGVFVELRDSLNTIWNAPPVSNTVRTFVVRRLFCFGMVLALGVLVVASLSISAAVGIAEKYFIELLPGGTAVAGELLNLLVSLAAMAILFALIFKFVPDVPIDWRDVGIGALVTAVLFTIGRMLLAFYLSTAGVGSTYGAAGSLVALTAWVYYSAQIFLFGAIFTRVHADRTDHSGENNRQKPRPKTAAKGSAAIK